MRSIANLTNHVVNMDTEISRHVFVVRSRRVFRAICLNRI